MKRMTTKLVEMAKAFCETRACDRFEMDPNEIHRLSTAMQGCWH